jgi:hypothetical protein
MPEMGPGFLTSPMPASVEGVASLFLSSSHTSCPTLSQATGKTAGLRHRHQTNGTPIRSPGCDAPRPGWHSPVRYFSYRRGDSPSKCNVVSFRTFHAISNPQSDANLHRHRIISAASGLSTSRTFLQFLYYIAHDRRNVTASSACGFG